MARKLKIKANAKPAVTILRNAIQNEKLVYIARVNKPHRYPWGRSRIVYIGTTKTGINRIVGSAASKASIVLGKWGNNQLDLHIVSSSKLQNVKTWRILEKDLLITFKQMFGSVPFANKQGKNMRWEQKRELFREDKLREVVNRFS